MRASDHTLSAIAIALLSGLSAQSAVHYVDATGTNSTPPFTNWATAATTIQGAIDAAVAGEEVVVTNGVYQSGGRVANGLLTNRVVVDKAIAVRSVNGAAVTVIQGNPQAGPNAVRCAYLTNGAELVGFTLTGGATFSSFWDGVDKYGGGAFCESNAVISNCVLTGNWGYEGGAVAYGTLADCVLSNNSASRGGGMEFSTLSRCAIIGNSAIDGGGGAFGILSNCVVNGNYASGLGGGIHMSELTDCSLTNNTAASYTGGGASHSTLTRCILVGNSARNGGGGASGGTLNDCTLIGNTVTFNGGGAFGSGLSRCTVSSNSAGGSGGGAWAGALNNCVLSGNSAWWGGATDSSGLNNCTVVGNQAWLNAGGILAGEANNCIVFFNSAPTNANYEGATLNYCCTTPLPGAGTDSFTNEPALVNLAGGDFRLTDHSPCINAGNNNYAPAGLDFSSQPRVVGGAVDAGAYEFSSPASTISYAWLIRFGLPIDGSADHTDMDHDGVDNWQEWFASTDPTNAASALRMLSALPGDTGITVTWTSASDRVYALERSSDLGQALSFTQVATNLTGQSNVISYVDTNAVGAGPFFYRVMAQFGPPAPPEPSPE